MRLAWPPELPIVEKRDEIAEAIAAHQVVVVCGETGSGKSTQLPKICLDAGRGQAGMIGVTQPRRIAARAIAERVAEELGEAIGRTVGWKVRFGDRTSADTRVKVMTDGILLAETQGDRQLAAYDTIILDEAHERSLNVDFLIGYLKRLLPRRPELKLIVTSATIDPQRFADHFGGAPVIEVSGRVHPVEVRWRPLDADAVADDEEGARLHAILAAVDELAAEGAGDVLVFLAGEREIREAAEALRKHHPRETEVLPLYARLSAAEQHRVFEPHDGRRIVLATNVAETSLTVPGIRAVVDPGLARINRYSPRSKVERLPVEPISRSAAKQRAGRCGRLGPGVCIRLYAEEEFAAREEFTPPEIERTNLAGVVLRMAALDLGDVRSFPFIDPPKKAAIRDGIDTLRELGAFDDRQRLTKRGRQLAQLPVDPRIGRMLLAARDEGCLREVLIIAAALSVPDPRERPLDRQAAADAAHRSLARGESDFLAYLAMWDFWHESRKHLSWSKLRAECRARFLSFMRMREWIEVHRQLHALLTQRGERANEEPADPDRIHRALLTGLLSNVGVQGENRAFTGAHGSTFHVFPGSSLFAQPPKWIMAAEVVETTRRYARTAARIRPAWIEAAGAHLLSRSYAEPHWDRRRGRVYAYERATLFGLEIVARRRVHYGPIDPPASRQIFIQHALVEGELDPTPPFLAHNRALEAELSAREAKRRRRDVLVEVHARYAFYESRVPANVYSAEEFRRWFAKAQRRDPDLLRMRPEDLLVPGAPAEAPDLFPDAMAIDALRLPLAYHHDPGAEDDGVTVTVPIGALPQVGGQRLDWTVPGMLHEKIVGLIRGLPKELRRSFVPVPDWAAACCARLVFGEGDLVERLGEALAALSGVRVPPEAWDRTAVADHLRMRVRVVDGRGEELAAGRDLDAIRAELRPRMRAAVDRLAGARFARAGITAWDFGDLPEEVAAAADGGTAVTGYPTLVDEGSSVALRLETTRAAADARRRSGLRRLFILEAGADMAEQLAHVPGAAEMRLAYAPLGPGTDVMDALALIVAERVFLGNGTAADGRTPPPAVMTESDFRARLDRGLTEVWTAGADAVQLVTRTLAARQAAIDRLAATTNPIFRSAVDDARRHLARLVPRDFLRLVPAARLEHYPRYLAAIVKRLERLPAGGHERDRAKMSEIQSWEARLDEQRARSREQGIVDPRIDAFRWLLEEYRVALFAQELGTAEPVSPKKVAAAWEEVMR
jgi:ATP-dependent helicase HrpA